MVSANALAASQTKDTNCIDSSIILTSPPLDSQSNCNKIRFQIGKECQRIGLGIAINSVIVQNNYRWLWENPYNHGTYLMDNDNHYWQHLKKEACTTCYFLFSHLIKLVVLRFLTFAASESQRNYSKPLQMYRLRPVAAPKMKLC